MAGEKLADLDRQIAEMVTMRAELLRILEEWDGKLSTTPDGESAFLLQSLSTNNREKDER
jgi:hypothetical protein